MIGWLDRINRIPWSRTLALFLVMGTHTAVAAWLVWIIWKGDWPSELAPARLEIIGRALFTVLAAVIVAVFAIAAISRLRIQGPAGTSVEMDGGPSTSADTGGPKP